MEANRPEGNSNVYTIVTQKIIEQLDKGTAPWQKPWKSGGIPRNLISKNSYRGVNLLLLMAGGYEHNLFVSFQQLQSIGGKVKRGEKGHLIVYWNKPQVKPNDNTHNQGEGEQKEKPVLRYYFVFNVSQCENIPAKYLPDARETEEILQCEAVIAAMPQKPKVLHKEQRAYYHPTEDFVNMPKKRSFKNDESYYSTFFHELVHSTGHETRLARKTLTEMSEFGSDIYSQEELVAEIGTCYLQAICGIVNEFESSAAYLQGWLQKLRNDKYFIFQAASAAQKAAEFILNKISVENDQSIK